MENELLLGLLTTVWTTLSIRMQLVFRIECNVGNFVAIAAIKSATTSTIRTVAAEETNTTNTDMQ